MSNRTDCPQCKRSPRMWHDGERWSCLCGWRGDADGYLSIDALARARHEDGRQFEDWEEPMALLWEKLPKDIGPLDVVLAKVKDETGGHWVALSKLNLQFGECGCCSSINWSDVVELRLVRINVEEP